MFRSFRKWMAAASAVLLAASGFGSAAVMAEDLEKPLELRITQGGFAGEDGTLWTIEPSGRWTRQVIAGNRVQPAKEGDDGVLPPERITALRETLARNGIDALPAKLGGPPRANPSKVTISYGDRKVELVLAPGAELTGPPADPSAQTPPTPESRVAAIAAAVREATGSR